MSNFYCQICNTAIIDNPNSGGYLTGCEHYPMPPELTKKEKQSIYNKKYYAKQATTTPIQRTQTREQLTTNTYHMKTITKQITKELPQLIIKHDEFTESPRVWTNIGYFFTKEIRYNSPDGTEHELYDCMLEGEEHVSNTEEHMEYIKTFAKRDYNIDIIHITPVYRHEHGRVLYKRGTAQGFDNSNCGFYIVTKETAEDMGVDQTDTSAMDIYIDGELDTYTKYVNGEVYGYELFDESGEDKDSCWGFYDLEDIKQQLPDEWKDEDLTKYIQW